MSVLKTIKNAVTPDSTYSADSNIHPNFDEDSLNSSVIPMLFLKHVSYDPTSGYLGIDCINAITHYIEEKLEANDIPISRYSWGTKPSFNDTRLPFSKQLNYDLKHTYHTYKNGKKRLVVRPSTTRAGTSYYFHTAKNTDHYINQHFEHSTADQDTVEQLVAEAITELNANTPRELLPNLQMHYAEIDPATYLKP